METRMLPLAEMLRLNTRLLLNALDGVDEETAHVRWCDQTNHMTFIAAHLVGARAYTAGLLGGDGTAPFEATLGGRKTIDDVEEWPTLDEIRAAWALVSQNLFDSLDSITTAQLDGELPSPFPTETQTVYGAATFLVQHDTYHIGQLGLLRKHFGLGALSYE